MVLLAPWSWSLLGADAATFGLRERVPLSFADVLHFDIGPAPRAGSRSGIVAAVVPLVIASGPRLVWATRAWVLALVSFALAWLPDADLGDRDGARARRRARPGRDRSRVRGRARRARRARRHAALPLRVAAGVGGRRVVGLALPLVALAADTRRVAGSFRATTGRRRSSWMSDVPGPGGFRVLWVGDPTVLPVDAKVVDGIGFALTRDGAGDARTLWAAPENGAPTACSPA